MKRILITGAGSYIGKNVELYIGKKEPGWHVEILDMQNSDWKKHDFSRYDVVFHVAGIAHADVSAVTEDVKQLYYDVNTKLAIETATKAKEEGVKQFILMSSMIVYGDAEYIGVDTQPKPTNFYGDSKWQADKGVRELLDDKFKVVVLRPPMIYGKGSKGNYPILAQMAGKLPVFPRVNNKRSMLYIENLCEFVRLMIANEERGVFHPQNETTIGTCDMVAMIAAQRGHRIWITSLLTPMVWIGRRVPGKIGNLCRKAFGCSYYDGVLSAYKSRYCVCTIEESIRRTEGA